MVPLHVVVGVDGPFVEASSFRAELALDPGVPNVVDERVQLVSCLGS